MLVPAHGGSARGDLGRQAGDASVFNPQKGDGTGTQLLGPAVLHIGRGH